MELVDANLWFKYEEVGAEGSCAHAAIFNSMEFLQALEMNAIDLPPSPKLPLQSQNAILDHIGWCFQAEILVQTALPSQGSAKE